MEEKMAVRQIISLFLIVTATTAAVAQTTTEATIRQRVSFKSVRDTFSTDLSNSTSTAFTSRASMIETQLEPVFRTQLTAFRSLMVTAFRNGSIVNVMDVFFESTSIPTSTQIANVLISASSNVTGFDIDGTSIQVNDEPATGGVGSHKISLVTASCLGLLSWLLSSQLC